MPHQPAFPRPLRGIVPPLVTPLADREELDLPGLERLIERQLGGGVAALFVLGTTGEGPSLSYPLRFQMVEHACELVAARLPVLVGVTDSSLVESLKLAEWSYDVGAAAIVAAPPFYFPVGQAELRRHFWALAEESPLPLFLYNMPACTKGPIAFDTIRALSEHPNIVGLKDSGGNLDYFREALALRGDRPDWTFLVGPEHLMAESVMLGGDGGVNGGANLCPRLFVELFQAADRCDLPRVAQLQNRLLEFGRIYQVGGQFAAAIQAIKCGLSWLGICRDHFAEPLGSLPEPQRREVETLLREFGLQPNALEGVTRRLESSDR